MSIMLDNHKSRPFSADTAKITKVRLQTSNCPTILKHEVINPMEASQALSSTMAQDRAILDRPRTANSTTKMKFSFLQSMRPMASPLSGNSMRPLSGVMNSTINFDFLNGIGKIPNGKFQDRSKIKPIKKLKTDQFHSVIYRVKQQKEVLEKDINRMEQWQKDFKENDIWNTPQSAIVESILRNNARSNPEGKSSRYLQNERDREDGVKQSKGFQRPTSAYSQFSRKNPMMAKSVQDFFTGDDGCEEIIEEILSPNRQYYDKYDSNKRRITDDMNRYVDNLENYNTLMQNTKDKTEPNAHRSQQGFQRYSNHSEEVLRERRDGPQYNNADDYMPGRTISEIVESHENSESSPNHQQWPQATQQNNRPFSASVTANTGFLPKHYASGPLSYTQSPKGKPPAIHTRPQTAKQTRIPPTLAISNGLMASGEPRQQSVQAIRFMPFTMEGQKISPKGPDMTGYRYKDSTLSSKGSSAREEFYGAQATSKFSKLGKGTRIKSEDESEADGSKVFQNRVLNSRVGTRTANGTQTQTYAYELGSTVGKLNIDGEYFQTYSEGGPKGRVPSASGRQKKSILDSWVSKDNLHSPQANVDVM